MNGREQKQTTRKHSENVSQEPCQRFLFRLPTTKTTHIVVAKCFCQKTCVLPLRMSFLHLPNFPLSPTNNILVGRTRIFCFAQQCANGYSCVRTWYLKTDTKHVFFSFLLSISFLVVCRLIISVLSIQLRQSKSWYVS